LTIEFDLVTRQFAVALQGDNKIYTISHIVDRTGRHLQEWDLYVGAQIDVLGRMTTLKKVRGSTAQPARLNTLLAGVSRNCTVE